MATETTKPRYAYKDGKWEVYLPLAPVPAARPRVSRWGTYYPKTYARWKKDADRILLPFFKIATQTEDPVYVRVYSVAKRPQRPTRSYPRPDVDNYAKAALDAVTNAQIIWHDDSQVIVLKAWKRYAQPGEEPHTYIRAITDEGLEFPRTGGQDVYDLPADCRVSLEDLA